MMAIGRDSIVECEVRRRRLKPGGGYEWFWKVKSVSDALSDADTEFRCKDCGGAVKLFRSSRPDSPPPHVEHKQRQDSEYCQAGAYFRNASDGREPRRSQFPVTRKTHFAVK
jgi:hypothetical protein